jgi:hypothetical protein
MHVSLNFGLPVLRLPNLETSHSDGAKPHDCNKCICSQSSAGDWLHESKTGFLLAGWDLTEV